MHAARFLAALALAIPCAGLPAPAQQPEIRLRYAAFDPLAGEPVVPTDLLADANGRLHIVQFEGPISAEQRAELRKLGVRLHRYLPEQSYVARLDPGRTQQVIELPFVRWVGPMHRAYRLAPDVLFDLLVNPALPAHRYNVMLVSQHEDEAALVRAIDDVGGQIHFSPKGGILAGATLTGPQVLALAGRDEVLWIDPWTEIGIDMDNARIQGGANYLEALGGHTGKGIRGHSGEGIYENHPEFGATPYRSKPIAVFDNTPYAHGSQVFGVMFAQGVLPIARAILPDGQGLYTHFDYVNANGRNALAQVLVDPNQPYQAMFWTSSWGYARSTAYTSRSAEMDQVVFDHDLVTIYTMGPSGGPAVRPSASAKNVIAVGGFFHYDNADPTDDCWCRSGGTGPAADGRIKPELSAFYDSVDTTEGPAGYTASFGGTSASTPMVAGYVGLALEVFTDGHYGYPAAPSWQDRFAHVPHFTTSKALVINTARQHTFSGAGHDMHRFHQGWGMPNMEDLWDKKDSTLVIDELDVLAATQRRSYWVFVPPGTAEFRATMTHADPPAVPAAAVTRINSLDLRVVAPGGTIYWGNRGLIDNMFSTAGGTPDDVNTLENVWLYQPAPGAYEVEVSAPVLREDSHVETETIDADYALVVSGLGGLRDRRGMELDLGSIQRGDLTITLQKAPASYAGGLTLLSATTQRPISTGNLFGLEADTLTLAIASIAPAQGNGLSFLPSGNPALFPNAPFAFPFGVASVLSGLTLDGVVLVYDARAKIMDVSNVSRVTVQ